MSAERIGTIAGCAAALRSGALTAVQLFERARARSDDVDPSIRAFLARTDELGLRQAEAADARLRDDPEGAGPLCRVPVALKDVLCLDGVDTTAGSQILNGFTPPYTGTAVERLLAAGAVVVGKTNCDEFAMGRSNENSSYAPVPNPWPPPPAPGATTRATPPAPPPGPPPS